MLINIILNNYTITDLEYIINIYYINFIPNLIRIFFIKEFDLITILLNKYVLKV